MKKQENTIFCVRKKRDKYFTNALPDGIRDVKNKLDFELFSTICAQLFFKKLTITLQYLFPAIVVIDLISIFQINKILF